MAATCNTFGIPNSSQTLKKAYLGLAMGPRHIQYIIRQLRPYLTGTFLPIVLQGFN